MIKATSCYLVSKRNDQVELIFNGTTPKHKKIAKKILGVPIESKLCFDEHIYNIGKTANKKPNDLCIINPNMKQNQKKLLSSSFVTYQLSYCHLT